jgi:hypothetical protein
MASLIQSDRANTHSPVVEMVASRSLRASDCSSTFPRNEFERRLDAIHKLGSVDFTYAFFTLGSTIRRICMADTGIHPGDPQEEQV